MTQAPGNVWKVLVKEGDSVAVGDTLFILEVMKTEVPHEAESALLRARHGLPSPAIQAA